MPQQPWRPHIIGIVAAVLLSCAAQAGPVEDCCRLWLIESPRVPPPGWLSEDGFRLIHRCPAYWLSLAAPDIDPQDLTPRPDGLNLGPWLGGMEYYLVYLASARPPAVALEELGRILHRDAATAVLEIPPVNAPLLHSAYSVERILPHALPAAPPAHPARALREAPLVHDPAVQSMADAVEIPRMHDEARYLQNLGTRRSDTQGAREAQEYLVQRFLDFGYVDVETHTFIPGYSDNVVVVKPGVVDPERIVVLGGHYDSISRTAAAPGADDNASGTVGVLEAARILAPYDLGKTVCFIAWSGEEQGLLGSAFWTARAAAGGLQVEAYLNLDMLGYLEGPPDLDIISNWESQWLRDLCFEAIPLYVPDLPVRDGFLLWGSSDHASFWAHGFPAVHFFEDSRSYSPYIHTSADVIGLSLNSFEFMQKNVQAALAVTAVLAVPVPLTIDHHPPEEQPVPDDPLTLEAVIRTAGALQPEALLMRYRGGPGRFEAVPLVPAGQPSVYVAELPGLPAGTVIEYYFEASDLDGRSVAHPQGAPLLDLHSMVVGAEVLHADDFESDTGWTVGRECDTAESRMWVRAIPAGGPCQPDHNRTPGGAWCYITGSAPPVSTDGADTVSGCVTSLVSPEYDLRNRSNVSLSYWRWYVNEDDPDGVFRVLISNNGGADWLLLEEVGETAIPWTLARFDDLEQILPLTGRMRLLFTAGGQGLPSISGAAIDDVVWRGVRRPPFGIAERPSPGIGVSGDPLSLVCRPNPAAGEVMIELRLAAGGHASLHVHDVHGRLVRTLLEAPVQAGARALSWDCIDESGHPVAPGVYWVRLAAGGGIRHGQVVVIR